MAETTWQERLKAEGNDLAERLAKLAVFVDTLAYDQLDDADKLLLQAQLGAMTAYLSILTMRCDKHGIAHGAVV